jgi:AcrR family transcriptional regulator
MTRTADAARREQLLERIVDYVCEHGLAGLALRPLAKAVGSSPRVLLYYFGSKDELIVAVIAGARERQRRHIAGIQLTAGASAREVCTMIWRVLGDQRFEPLFRLWFEVYGLALQDRNRFPGFLERAVEDWLDFLTPQSVARGFSLDDSRAWATMIVAGFRGFMMDLTATHDRARVDRAVELWLGVFDDAAA